MNQEARYSGSVPPSSRLSTLNKELEMVLVTLPNKNVYLSYCCLHVYIRDRNLCQNIGTIHTNIYMIHLLTHVTCLYLISFGSRTSCLVNCCQIP